MMPTKLQLEIVTPEKKVLSETVDEVVLPGREGYLGVLPGHTPLLTSLKIGEVEYRKGTEKHRIALAWGFAEVLPDKVTVLADLAEREDEIDLDRARRRKEEIERQLKAPPAEFDFAKAQEALEKAIVRIDVATAAAAKRLPGEPPRRAPRSARIKTDDPGA